MAPTGIFRDDCDYQNTPAFSDSPSATSQSLVLLEHSKIFFEHSETLRIFTRSEDENCLELKCAELYRFLWWDFGVHCLVDREIAGWQQHVVNLYLVYAGPMTVEKIVVDGSFAVEIEGSMRVRFCCGEDCDSPSVAAVNTARQWVRFFQWNLYYLVIRSMNMLKNLIKNFFSLFRSIFRILHEGRFFFFDARMCHGFKKKRQKSF